MHAYFEVFLGHKVPRPNYIYIYQMCVGFYFTPLFYI